MFIKNTIIIRADVHPKIGTGHVMRCLALAEAWQDTGGEVFFVTVCDAPALEVRLKKERIQILHINHEAGSSGDADETARIAHEHGADWIVVDGYHFGAEYQKAIKDSGLSLLFIDDYGHADYYYADIILNQNIYADMSFYPNYEPYTRFLLGTKYALIRKEFLKWSGWHRDIPEVARKILVTFGGSDPDNVTLKLIKALRTVDTDRLEVIVVIGITNPHFDLIHETVKDLSNFTLLKNTENMPELMAWADIAISAGGSTILELAFMGLPSIIHPIADNQKAIADGLISKELALVISDVTNCDPHDILVTVQNFLSSSDFRDRMSCKMKTLVDGQGTDRIIQWMIGNRIRIRNAGSSDSRLVWEWANDYEARKSAFTQKTITFADHQEWFVKKQKDPDCFQYIALNVSDIAIGQIRFDRDGESAEIDISIAPEWRNKGLSSELIKLGCEKIFRTEPVRLIRAHVKAENITSIRAFERGGFLNQGKMTMHGYDVIYLTKRKPDTGCEDHK